MSIDIASLVREDFRDFVPYEPHDYEKVIKMDANENPYPFPEEVLQVIYKRVKERGITRYPDPLAKNLRVELAKYTGVTPEQIIVGNGADEIIQLLLLVFGGPGTRTIIPSPTFSMYAIHTTITGGNPLVVPMTDDFSLPMEELLREVEKPENKVTFLCSPNNPTGNAIPVSQIEELLQKAKGIVVADEAYLEFYNRETCTPLLQKYNNLAIIRTFSKAFALAGLRVGYMLGSREIIREMMKLKQPYNVNAFSQEAAITVLEHRDIFKPQVELIIAERERVFEALKAMPGIKVYPSGSNYLMFRTEKPGPEVHHALIEKGVLIRNLHGGPGLDNCLRVTIGKKEENDVFLEKLKEIL